jgi:uncharacterized membrane protein
MFSFINNEVLMSKILSTIGIILVVAGTIFSLWSILGTKGNCVQTADWYDHQQENFKKDKRKVIIGTISIIIGSTLQIIGLFI